MSRSFPSGLTTEIHAVVDRQGRPVRLGLTAGQGAVPDIPAKSNPQWRPCLSKALYRVRTQSNASSASSNTSAASPLATTSSPQILGGVKFASVRLWLRAFNRAA